MVTSNPSRKSQALPAEIVGTQRERWKAKLEASALDDVLAQLGHMVGRYTVATAWAFDGRPDWEGRDNSAGDGRVPCYAITYEMRRPGRPLFRCGGAAGQFFATLHAAAVWALLGALAWSGAFSQEGL